LIAAVIAFNTEKLIIIAATSFMGSYFVIRGISQYAGGFPNETSLKDELQSGALAWDTFPKAFYGYLAGIVVLTGISIVYQRRHNKRN